METLGLEKQNSREDFKKYFLNVTNFKNLAEDCINGTLRGTFNCRWTAWRAYLGLLPIGDEAKMREEVKKQRTFYAGEYDKYVNYRSKAKLNVMDDNPLSTSSKNPWNSFYGDTELKDEIKKDIERTYQDMDFFIDKNTQQVLTNVLFIWSKQNLDLSYRQGMNELVAVLTYTCFTENFKPENPANDIYDYLNDEKFAEADIYTAFKRLLDLDQKSMFVVTQPTSKNAKQKKKTDSDAPQRPNLPVVHRAALIQEELLPQFHPQVFNHMKSLQVEPHIYMMRWLRCILVREFKIQQALQVWDSIFGYHYQHPPATKKLEMLDYMCVTMIINLAQDLLEIDNNGMLLGKLLRYPPTENVTQFIETCHHEVLNNLGSEGFKPKEPVVIQKKQQQQQPIVEKKDEEKSASNVAPQEDSKSPITAGGSKKIVLFNPEMPIFKGGKDGNPLAETSSPQKQAKSPTPTFKEEPVKKVESDKPKPTLFSANPIDKLMEESKKLLQYIQPIPAKQPEAKETVVFSQSKAFQSKEEPALHKSASNEPKAAVEEKSGPVLFSSSDKTTRNPFASHNTTKANNDVIPGTNNTQKDVNDGIKKLQNAIKLMKLENEKNQSLGLQEAIEDVNEVLKIMKEKLSKN